MSGKTIKIIDRFNQSDSAEVVNSHHTLWQKTRIMGGYGMHMNSRGMFSYFDELLFDKENMVPLVGVEYAMEKIYGVKAPIDAPTLNSKGIGNDSATVSPSGGNPYPYGHKVCLFGVGIGGAAENNTTTIDIGYHETDIVGMVPFRYTNDALSELDQRKYFGMKEVDGVMAYYLKAFDSDPVIHNLFKNGEDGEDGSEVTASYLNDGSATGVETCTDVILTVSKKDLREWFTAIGDIESCRVNSIALYSAIKDGDDYSYIQLFSKLNIPSEPMSLSKDLNIIYRTYGS